MSTNLKNRYGPWALITGAARKEGLGYSFARKLAAAGINLLLVDILETELHQRANELHQKFQIDAIPVTLDLGQVDFMPQLKEIADEKEVGLLICNHMFTPADTPKILDMELDIHHQMLNINARAYTSLLHSYGRQMRARNKGGIVVVSSGAGLMPAPYTGAYAANKAFQIALGEVLWYELKETAVDVVVQAAGLMDTQGDALSKYPQFMVADPTDVVEETLANLGKKHLVVPGLINKLFLFMQLRLMSRRRAINSIGSFMERGLGKRMD